MRQRRSAELLDEDLGTPQEIRDSLQDLWRVNRYLGGLRSLRHLMEYALRRKPLRAVRVLDAGAGSGKVGAWMQQWLTRRGVPARVWVLDRKHRHLTQHPPEVIPVVGDALALPFPDQSFDLVACNLFLHHFHGEAATTLLRSLYRVAGTAVLISDLERSLWPWLVIRLTPRPLVSRLSRFDGPASVRQAYRRDELLQLFHQAGLPRPLVWRQWPYRLGAVLWREEVESKTSLRP
jgi:SAM-dependent methyltransferase